MKRKIVFLLISIGFIGSIIGLIRIWNNRSPKQGVIKINSQPPASIFIENKHIGKTPYEDKIQEGDYTIKLVPESAMTSAAPWQGRIGVKQNLLTYINADLSDTDFTSAIDLLWLEKVATKKSQIAVTTNPDGSTVTLDGESKGTTPLMINDITPGDHTLLIYSPGFLSRQLKIKTHEGYKLVASLKLALTAEGTSGIEIAASESALSLNVASISATPLLSQSPTRFPSGTPMPVSSASASAAIEKPYIVVTDTPTGFLRVRMEPKLSATESGRVNPGEQYHILDTVNGWFKITFEGTKTGWVSSQYADKVE